MRAPDLENFLSRLKPPLGFEATAGRRSKLARLLRLRIPIQVDDGSARVARDAAHIMHIGIRMLRPACRRAAWLCLQKDGTLRYLDVVHHLISDKVRLADPKPSSRMVAVLSLLSHELRTTTNLGEESLSGRLHSWWAQYAPAGSHRVHSLAVPYEPAEYRFRHYYACRILQRAWMRMGSPQERGEGANTLQPTGRVLPIIATLKSALRHRRACSYGELQARYWRQVCLRIEAESRLRKLELARLEASGPGGVSTAALATANAGVRGDPEGRETLRHGPRQKTAECVKTAEYVRTENGTENGVVVLADRTVRSSEEWTRAPPGLPERLLRQYRRAGDFPFAAYVLAEADELAGNPHERVLQQEHGRPSQREPEPWCGYEAGVGGGPDAPMLEPAHSQQGSTGTSSPGQAASGVWHEYGVLPEIPDEALSPRSSRTVTKYSMVWS